MAPAATVRAYDDVRVVGLTAGQIQLCAVGLHKGQEISVVFWGRSGMAPGTLNRAQCRDV